MYNTFTKKISAQIITQPTEKIPVTAVRWRPLKSPKQSKNVLLTISSNGTIQQWHVISGKCLASTKEEMNELYCTDYNEDGTKFATSGKDGRVRIYDDLGHLKTPIIKLESTLTKPGHSNRIFCVKFDVTTNPNIIASGGWDHKIIIWDIRSAEPIYYLQGPAICGDSIDIVENQLLAGSWRTTKQLQLYDLRKGEKLLDIDLIPGKNASQELYKSCFVYTAQLSKLNGNFAICGGSKLCEAYVINQSDHFKQIFTVSNVSRPIYTCEFAHDSNMFALGSGDGIIRLYDIKKKAL